MPDNKASSQAPNSNSDLFMFCTSCYEIAPVLQLAEKPYPHLGVLGEHRGCPCNHRGLVLYLTEENTDVPYSFTISEYNAMTDKQKDRATRRMKAALKASCYDPYAEEASRRLQIKYFGEVVDNVKLPECPECGSRRIDDVPTLIRFFGFFSDRFAKKHTCRHCGHSW